MSSDLVVALAPATQDGHTYIGHNCNRPRGDAPSIVRTPGRQFVPGECVGLPHVHVTQVRHTRTTLAIRCRGDWGYHQGINEKGVAVGCTTIRTRLEADAPGLSGSELVRLALERATTACQAVEVLTDLISRHGQGAHGGQGADSAFLVADCEEACVLEASGRHWAEAEVGSVRAVTGVCLLRQDWDRISRGLSTLAIERGWWPDDGRKLDFAGTVGAVAADHAQCMRRWGQATLRLEHGSGRHDEASVRRLLCDQGELVASPSQGPSDVEIEASFLARLGPSRDDLPVAWCAFGAPGESVYLPLFLAADPPGALGDEEGMGSPLRRVLSRWQADSRHDPRLRAALHSGLAGLQQRLDEHLYEMLPEAAQLHRQGRHDELSRLVGSFMQYTCERFEELAAALRGGPVDLAAHEELVEAW